MGLTKIYQRQEKYHEAGAAIDAAVKLSPDRTDLHYLRGQMLLHLGRKEEGKKELERLCAWTTSGVRKKRSRWRPGAMPSPELSQEQQ